MCEAAAVACVSAPPAPLLLRCSRAGATMDENGDFTAHLCRCGGHLRPRTGQKVRRPRRGELRSFLSGLPPGVSPGQQRMKICARSSPPINLTSLSPLRGGEGKGLASKWARIKPSPRHAGRERVACRVRLKRAAPDVWYQDGFLRGNKTLFFLGGVLLLFLLAAAASPWFKSPFPYRSSNEYKQGKGCQY